MGKSCLIMFFTTLAIIAVLIGLIVANLKV